MMEQEQKMTQTFYKQQDNNENNDEDEEVKGEDQVAADIPDYQRNVIGQQTFYGGGFGNINQTDWSDEEDSASRSGG